MIRTVNFVALVIVTSFITLGQASAQPNIVVAGGAPWSNFTVTGADIIVFEFERDPSAGTTLLAMTSPGPGAPAFPLLAKDGAPCLPADDGNCTGRQGAPSFANNGKAHDGHRI